MNLTGDATTDLGFEGDTEELRKRRLREQAESSAANSPAVEALLGRQMPDEKTVQDFLKAGPPRGKPRWKGERIQND